MNATRQLENKKTDRRQLAGSARTGQTKKPAIGVNYATISAVQKYQHRSVA
jgi:hypothetical protein